jgi:hypothetical protein
MWSLAIEEQFYLAWPLLLGALFAWPAVRRNPARLAGVALIAAAASAVAMGALYEPANPSRSYFGTDTRAHALLVGCALALLAAARPELLRGPRAAAIARRGWPFVVGLLALALVSLDDQGGFYYHGGSLLFALAVAALLWIIEALPQSPPARLLSTPPFRWVGRISYGLYLWHWPILVWIGDPRAGRDPLSTQLLEIGLTVAVAALSFYLLERPVREGRAPWLGRSRRRLVVAAVVSFELVWFVALMGTMVTTSNSAIARGLKDLSDTPCPAGSPAYAGQFTWCTWVRPTRPDAPLIATAGDSTARALDPGLQELASTRGWGYVQTAQGGCSFVGLLFANPDDASDIANKRNCATGIPAILAAVSAQARPDIWIVADRVLAVIPLIREDGRVLHSGPARDAILASAIRSTLRRMTAHGARVIVVGTPPRAEPVDCVVRERRAATCDRTTYTTSEPLIRALNATYRKALTGLGRSVVYVTIDDLLCPRGGRCPALVDGVIARYDGLHYSAAFSRRLVPLIIARARRAGIAFTRG